MEMVISLAQMDVVLGNPDQNLAKARPLAAEAASRGSQLLVLPELWSTGYDLENAARYAASIDQGIFNDVAALAEKYHLHILGSNLSLFAPGKFGNTAVLFGPQGDNLAIYTKIHLFRLMAEHQFLWPGDHPTLAETPWGKAGLAICYDLRFPELFRAYALQGAKMVLLPAEWPRPRLEHWQVLLRARAIENQMYIIACNRVGSSKENAFFGHSAIIDPWGETVIEAGEDETLVTARIEIDLVDQVRAKIPVFQDRRPSVYESYPGG
jgi:predicted amidohydrolase